MEIHELRKWATSVVSVFMLAYWRVACSGLSNHQTLVTLVIASSETQRWTYANPSTIIISCLCSHHKSNSSPKLAIIDPPFIPSYSELYIYIYICVCVCIPYWLYHSYNISPSTIVPFAQLFSDSIPLVRNLLVILHRTQHLRMASAMLASFSSALLSCADVRSAPSQRDAGARRFGICALGGASHLWVPPVRLMQYH